MRRIAGMYRVRAAQDVSGQFYALPAARATTWQPGITFAATSGAMAPASPPSGWAGGIPARSTIFTTLSPSGGDDTAAINTAITNCTVGQTVKLALGQFNISGTGIRMKSGVTLRGSGPGTGMGGALTTFPSAGSATLLVKTDGLTNPYPVVVIADGVGMDTMFQTAAFASDAVKGAFSVTLSGSPPAGLAVGQIVYVNEQFDSSLVWFNTTVSAGQGDNSGFLGWGEGQTGTIANSRALGEAKEVASIVGNVITFTSPFHTTYRTSKNAHMGTVNATSVTWAGLEELFLTGGDGGDGGGNIMCGYAAYCWVKHVESAGHGPQYGGGLVHFYGSFRCELRDSYLHALGGEVNDISPGGKFYNLVIDAYTSDTLVENCISWFANKVMVMRSCGGGNVIGYNYMDDGYGNTYPNQGEAGINGDHMATTHHVLFEGNVTHQCSTESRWGNSIYNTWFRNWARAQRVSAWSPSAPNTAFGNPLTSYVYNLPGTGDFYYEDEYNRGCASVGDNHWHFNFVGNVLGMAGNVLLGSPRSAYVVPQTSWVYQNVGNAIPATIDQNAVPVWNIGGPDGSETTSYGGNGLDPGVIPTLLRDCNYDYATDGIYWHGVGGTSQSQITGPGASATGSSVLPKSLYMSSKPSFFGSETWPCFDGGNKANPLPGNQPAYKRFGAGTPNTL